MNFEIGKQPCNNFESANENAGWSGNVHQCIRCYGEVSFCDNCKKDHHNNGYETCKRKEQSE